MQARARPRALLRALLTVTVVAMAAMAVAAYFDGNVLGAEILGACIVLLVPGFVFGARTDSFYATGNYLAGVVVACVVALAWIRGGVVVAITGWLAFVPMVASMLGRWRVAIAWCSVVMVSVTGLALAEWAALTPASTQPSLLVRWSSQAGLVALSLWLVRRVRLLAQDRQKLLSERAVAGQKLESLGRLAGGIAHDFNNALAVVLARVDGALQGVEPEDSRYADLHAIRTAAKRGASLASELVAFSRRGPATYDVMRPVDVVRGAEQVIGRLVGENIQISFDVDESVPPIEGDRDHLLQVLLNLAINAQDAMLGGGHLRIQLWADAVSEPLGAATGIIAPGQYAVISVSDEGAGMSADVQARVFEPFFTTKDRGQGSGIGLATVHAIITQHGGHVRLSSKLGVGSTFEVYLPLTRRSEELRETTDDLHREGVRTNLRVLLVEDDALVRRALEVMLSRAGHRIVPAANGAEAIVRWDEATDPFDVVLTDVLMPGMTGPDLIRQLRIDTPNVRVVYMSGHVDDAMRDVDLERERAVFVRKPASRAALLGALDQAVRSESEPPSQRPSGPASPK